MPMRMKAVKYGPRPDVLVCIYTNVRSYTLCAVFVSVCSQLAINIVLRISHVCEIAAKMHTRESMFSALLESHKHF